MKFFVVFISFFAALACVSGTGYGGGSSIPAPPCPKNYLFSCQPNLTPAPCSPPAPSYGSAGAYSENLPSYIGAPLSTNRQYQQRPDYYNIDDLRNFQGFRGYQQ